MKSLDVRSIRQASDWLVGQSVEGLVVVTPRAPLLQALRERDTGVPMVVAGGAPASGLPTASADQHAGASEATKHLLALGHATVWHLAGPSGWDDAEGRVTGWRETLEQAGVEAPPVHCGDWSAASGWRAGTELARRRDVSAVFVANDQMALGATLAFKEAGRRIPEDISIVGFDDIPEAPYFDPPLTTVRQDFEELGRRGVELLVRALGGDDSESAATIVPQFVARRSTAPPRSAPSSAPLPQV